MSVTVIDCISPRRELLPLIPPTISPTAYPVDALGGVLGDAARAIAALVQCPTALAAQSVLATASLATQGHADVMHPIGKPVPISLMFVTVAESGERKSTADGLALEAVEQAAREAEQSYRLAYARWRNACEANEAARSAAKKKSKGDAEAIKAALNAIGADPPAPLHPRRAMSDMNYEGVVKFMPTAHGSLAWFNNEAGQSVGGTALHEDNKLKFGAGLSRFWDGQAVDRVRAGDGAHFLRGRRLTVHLMLQPGIAHLLLGDPLLRAQGLFSRMLVCAPASNIGRRPFRAPAEADRAKLSLYHARIRELVEAECSHAEAANELTPPTLALNADALAAWTRFHDAVEASCGEGGELAALRGFGSKLAENALRMAGVMAVFEQADAVEKTHMVRAIELADYYASEAKRAADEAAIGADIMLAEKTRLWLTNAERWPHDSVSARDIMRCGPNPARSKPKAEAMIAILGEYGWLTPAGDGKSYAIEGRDE